MQFPEVTIHQSLCGCGSGPSTFTGSEDPNGFQAGKKGDVYTQVASDGSARIWTKTTDEGNTGWI